MKNLLGSRLVASRYPLAIMAGLVLAAAFPKIGLAGFAWIGPGLFLAAALGKQGWERFRIGYVGGLAYYLASLYWLLFIPFRWHGIPLGPAAGWLALSAYLACYPAVWVWMLGQSTVHGPPSTVEGLDIQVESQGNPESTSRITGHASLIGSPPSKVEGPSPGDNLSEVANRTWFERTLWAIGGAAVWVALEMVVARLFSGFPWDLLGVSQYQMVPLIQIASVTGVYGVSFLIVWVSISLLLGGLMLLRRPGARSIWIGEIFLPVLVVALCFNVGFRHLRQAPPASRTLRVTFVQPSIPQTLIWDPNNDEKRFQEMIQLSEQALTNRTDLLLWPESAIPKLLRYDKQTFEAVTGLARKHHVWLIVGADDAEPRQNPSKPHQADYFNSSFLFSPEGELVDGYKKRSLVIFGEYIPLERWLPFMKFFTPIPGGFTPGDRAVPFDLTDRQVRITPLICFEDVFPGLARDCARIDADLLVNMTNDGWFGRSAAPWQHAASALFRSVENGIPLLRCTNNGLTCWIDSCGRLRQICRDDSGTVYGRGIMTAEIPLLAQGQKVPHTFYTDHGDWFGWGCVGVALLMLVRKAWTILTGRADSSN